MRQLAICLAFAAVTLVVRSALATTFDTVDSVQLRTTGSNGSSHMYLVIQGIPAGGSTSTSQEFDFGNITNSTANQTTELATHCERLALLAMSKPGKFRFAITSNATTNTFPQADCRLTAATP
jgi:hypothetical protein